MKLVVEIEMLASTLRFDVTVHGKGSSVKLLRTWRERSICNVQLQISERCPMTVDTENGIFVCFIYRIRRRGESSLVHT